MYNEIGSKNSTMKDMFLITFVVLLFAVVVVLQTLNSTNQTMDKVQQQVDGYTWVIDDGVPVSNNYSSGTFYLDLNTNNIYTYIANIWQIIGSADKNASLQSDSAVSIDKDGFWSIGGATTDVRAIIKSNDNILVSMPLDVSYFSDKKITIIGDSITYGSGSSSKSKCYANVLGNLLGASIENLGISKTSLCENVENASGNLRKSRLEDVRNYKGETDYFIVALGTNDWNSSEFGDGVQLGTLGSMDTSTIYGAVNVYAQTLKQKFKNTNTKIYFSTPIIVNKDGEFSSITKNSFGYSLRDLCNAIIETAAMYNIPTLDMNLFSGIYYNSETDNSTSETMKDNLHPNDNGHELMAKAMANYLLKNYFYVSY